MFRLLALDLDGTLLRRDGSVHPADRAALSAVRAHGVEVTVATGRLYAGAQEAADSLSLSGPLVCADGASIVDHPEGQQIRHRGISGELGERLRSALRPHGFAVFALAGGRVMADARGGAFESFLKSWTPTVERCEEVLDDACWQHADGVSVAVVIGLAGAISKVCRLLSDMALEVLRFDVSRGAKGMTSLLIHAAGVSKGDGVRRVADIHGFGLSQVVAVGDWLNDVSMFEVAGRSYAMRTAPAKVTQAATVRLQADAGAGGGVAEAIAHAWPELAATIL